MQDDDLYIGSLSHSEVEGEREKWAPRFLEVVRQDKDARQALDFLVAGGMDGQHVANGLFWYTHPVSAYYQSRNSTLAS